MSAVEEGGSPIDQGTRARLLGVYIREYEEGESPSQASSTGTPRPPFIDVPEIGHAGEYPLNHSRK